MMKLDLKPLLKAKCPKCKDDVAIRVDWGGYYVRCACGFDAIFSLAQNEKGKTEIVLNNGDFNLSK